MIPLILAALAFSPHVTNPWYPLKPGTVYHYKGVKDGEPSTETLRVTHRTAVIDGAPCVVIEDRLYLSGKLEERTTEWYSQDANGNVWYFGENTAELDKHGKVVTREGSWRAGRNGARAGIFMYAHPKVGQRARQEFYKGHAEDHFAVISVKGDTIVTKEWTPLEPKVLDHKTYKRGVGNVLELTVRGPLERNTLVSVERP